MVLPFPFSPDRSYPDSLLATIEEALAPGRVDLKVVALTGAGRGGRTGHPAVVGCPARLLGSAVQPSVPPSLPRCPIAGRASPALPPPPQPLVLCLDLQRKVGASQGRRVIAVRAWNSRGESRGPLASHIQRSETKDGGLKACAETLQRSQAK